MGERCVLRGEVGGRVNEHQQLAERLTHTHARHNLLRPLPNLLRHISCLPPPPPHTPQIGAVDEVSGEELQVRSCR